MNRKKEFIMKFTLVAVMLFSTSLMANSQSIERVGSPIQKDDFATCYVEEQSFLLSTGIIGNIKFSFCNVHSIGTLYVRVISDVSHSIKDKWFRIYTIDDEKFEKRMVLNLNRYSGTSMSHIESLSIINEDMRRRFNSSEFSFRVIFQGNKFIFGENNKKLIKLISNLPNKTDIDGEL